MRVVIKSWLKQSFNNMMYGEEEYLDAGDLPGHKGYYRTNKYIKEVIEHLNEQPWTKEEKILGHPTDREIYDEAELELYDDFHNCGGIILNRIWDIHCLYHHLPKLQNELLDFIAVEIETEMLFMDED